MRASVEEVQPEFAIQGLKPYEIITVGFEE